MVNIHVRIRAVLGAIPCFWPLTARGASKKGAASWNLGAGSWRVGEVAIVDLVDKVDAERRQ
jgi:hypothetical protein